MYKIKSLGSRIPRLGALWKNQDPPGLDEIFKNIFSKKKVSPVGGSGGSGSEPIKLPLGVSFFGLLLLWCLSGLFVIAPAEQAVVLQFGKYHSTLNPGLHWVPRFIQSETTVNIQRISSFSYEAEMLTTDENIVDVAVSIQYRVNNPYDYLYHAVDPRLSLKEATASALRQVVGATTLDNILTKGREEAKLQVAEQLKSIIALYEIGLEITDVNLLPAQPPQQVTAAFDDAIKAREDEQRFINQAKAYGEKVVPIAEGKAARTLQEAEADRQRILMHAQASVAKFTALLPSYRVQPSLVERKLYLDGMQSVLANTTKVVVDSDKSTPFLYLPIDQMIKGGAVDGHTTGEFDFTGELLQGVAADSAGQSPSAEQPASGASKASQSSSTSARRGYSSE